MKSILHLITFLLVCVATAVALVKHGPLAALTVGTIGTACVHGVFVGHLGAVRLCTSSFTLTGLTESLYQARDIIARERVGAINSVIVNGGSEGVSLGGTVKSVRSSQPTLNTTYTPAMTIPEGDAQTLVADEMTIGQVANVQIPLQGEAFAQVAATIGVDAALKQIFVQSMRTITNAIEAHVLSTLYKGASRAVGTAGTTPFASSHALILNANQILKDNGVPNDGLTTLVLNTSAGTNLKSLSHIYKVNESGASDTIRNGVLLDIDGVMIKESAQVASHTKGAGTGYDVASGGEAIGQTTLTLEGGTVNTTGIKAGDCVTFDTDTANTYVVGTGLTATGGDIVIGAPGLRVAGVDASELTIGNSYTANVMFHKYAAELVMRPPSMPPNLAGGRGDAAAARVTLFDPVSGLVFEAALYLGYGKNIVDITTFYQAKVWKSDFVAVLRG